MNSIPKPVEWIASSLDDLKNFPEDVQQAMGYALYRAQCGEKHSSVKPLKGFKGASILEVVQDLMGTPIEQFIPLGLRKLYMYYMFFRKSLSMELRLPSKILS